MNYKAFQNIKLSGLGMGNMRLPSTDPKNPSAPIDYPEAFKIDPPCLRGRNQLFRYGLYL